MRGLRGTQSRSIAELRLPICGRVEFAEQRSFKGGERGEKHMVRV